MIIFRSYFLQIKKRTEFLVDHISGFVADDEDDDDDENDSEGSECG